MKYRNIETGAVIEVGSEMGGKWEPVEAPSVQEEKPKTTAKKTTAKKTTTTRKKKGEA